MGSIDKLIERFKTLPSDFTYNELKRLLWYFGYEEGKKGKTSGSRVAFKQEGLQPILLHKPHPGNIVKKYALEQVFDHLINNGFIAENEEKDITKEEE
ncbi:type II toxin-antitoxin system HicA family toxin [Bacteroides sp. 519]|uniref:type II toxin-antitoxin system HicA family toxin n=1 Tax=Bacteroides sp. 519 TaxID=2302937 RepID=UPI0013D3831E|nr:type II toxin-antitoxin system HicA family toxin [Bacteroides sp. 519]NDV57516.1 type II toxin-antitoxin system HicA family toxin [Bacteroides sp. 519]